MIYEPPEGSIGGAVFRRGSGRGYDPSMQDDLARTCYAIERPDPSLFTYYFLTSLLLGPFFFIVLLPLYFRYHTMRYHIDDEGISMKWGILFRREISLTYARIQDIHLTSNFVERWFGLARIQIQTASGSSSAEMTIEGVKEFAAVRDFLYSRMRGIRGAADEVKRPAAAVAAAGADPMAELAREMRAIRELLERIVGETRR
jgi:uncharacterized membrane protein YdbT with pleckstrin-like domain